tara:strand:- start:475 stop:963 length:489 start_codon:yes stop_codon:yes gene_type:complete
MSATEMFVEFPGSITAANRQRTAKLAIRCNKYDVWEIGFAKSNSSKTKMKWFPLEDMEVLIGGMLEFQGELAAKLAEAKAGIAAGYVISDDGHLVVPPPPEAVVVEEPKASEPKASKVFSLGSVAAVPAATVPAAVTPPPPPPAAKTLAERLADRRSALSIR